jgi:hypothetical protein
LWGRIPDGEWQRHEPYNPPHDTGDYCQQDVHPTNDCNKHPDQTEEVPHEEQKKKWYDLDDQRKKQLEIGGGLLAGAALIGGGYVAWHEHEKKKTEDEKQALTWGAQGWQRDAHARTEEFRNHGPRDVTSWVLVEGRTKIPRSALQAGKDKDGNPIYIARVYFEDSIQIGKASPVFPAGSVIGYGGRTVELNKFEVLIGDPRGIKWVPCRSRLNIRGLGDVTLVDGGREANGSPLFIARAEYEGGWHTCKAAEHLPAAQLAFSGKEVTIQEYEVLCLN